MTLIDQTIQLDFTVTSVVGSGPTIDRNISDWTNAYPVHLQTFGDPNSVTPGDETDAVAYTLADANNYYYALKVTDNIHNQTVGGPVCGNRTRSRCP